MSLSGDYRLKPGPDSAQDPITPAEKAFRQWWMDKGQFKVERPSKHHVPMKEPMRAAFMAGWHSHG